MSTKIKKVGKIITTSVIFILSFIMIISNFANIEAPLYNSTHRDGSEESEMNAANFIYYNSNNGTVYADRYHKIYFHYVKEKNNFGYNLLQLSENINFSTEILAIRDYSIKNYFIIISPREKQVGYSNSTLLEGEKFNIKIFDRSNKIYDCESVLMYKK